MPRKQLSTMTAQDFVRAIGALGLRHKDMGRELARVLGRQKAVSLPSVSNYATGRQIIPLDIAQAVHTLCDQQATELEEVSRLIKSRDFDTRVSNLIQYQNDKRRRSHRLDRAHSTAGRFMNRQSAEGMSTKLLAPYRIRLKYYPVLVRSLAAWHQRVLELARLYTDQARQRDYQLEVADIKALAAGLPRALPYEAHVSKAEWQVIGRALRHDGTKEAIALYQHWKKHKGCGFPVDRLRSMKPGVPLTQRD